MTSSDNDTYTFKEMLQQKDRVEFIKAMQIEIQDHENKQNLVRINEFAYQRFLEET